MTPDILTTYLKAFGLPYTYDEGSNSLDYIEVTEWYELGMQILELDANSHEAYAKANVFIRRTRKKRKIVLGIPGTTLPLEVDYSLIVEYMNGWTWKV